MTQFFALMDKLKEMNIVQFFAKFFTEERMAPVLKWFSGATGSGRDPADYARDLILVAVLIALVTFVVDQVFYWTNPQHIDRSRRSWRVVNRGIQSLGQSIRMLAGRRR